MFYSLSVQHRISLFWRWLSNLSQCFIEGVKAHLVWPCFWRGKWRQAVDSMLTPVFLRIWRLNCVSWSCVSFPTPFYNLCHSNLPKLINCLPKQSNKPGRIRILFGIILCHVTQLSEMDPEASERASVFWITIVSSHHYSRWLKSLP